MFDGYHDLVPGNNSSLQTVLVPLIMLTVGK